MFKKQYRVWWALPGLALAGLLLWQLAARPVPASAHALLVRSMPEANAELSQPPATIELWFSEPLEAGFSNARLLNSTGAEIPAGPVSLDPADPTHLVLPLNNLEPGIYTVAWQNLSQADGHEFYGSFPLTILNPDGSRPGGAAITEADGQRGELPTPGEVVARWLGLLGGALFFGAPLFYSWVVVGREVNNPALVDYSRVLVLKAIWLAALAIVLGGWLQIILLTFRLGELNDLPNLLLGTRTGVLGLARQPLVLSGLLLALWQLPPVQPVREPRFWLEVAVYQFVVLVLLSGAIFKGEWLIAGTAFIIAGVGLLPLLQSPDPAAGESLARKLLLFLAAVLLLSFSLGSHAGAAPGWVWAVLSDYLHFLAAAAWLGGLVLLPLLIWRTRQPGSALTSAGLWPLIQRFSRLATLAVFVLVVTGLFNSLVQLPNLTDLFEATYGWVLLVKLALTVLVLGIAFLNNRLMFRRHPSLPEPELGRRLQRQVTLEAIFSLGLMLSVAVLVQTSKPAGSATSAIPPNPFFEYITQADDLQLHTQVLPNQVGQNLFLIHLYHQDNSPIGEVQLVRLFFNYQEAQLGQAEADLEPRGGNIYGLEGAYLNQAGSWKLSVYVRRRGMDDILTDINLDVPAATGPAINADPWQNPIPGWPVGWVIAGVVVAGGAGCFLWFWLRRGEKPVDSFSPQRH